MDHSTKCIIYCGNATHPSLWKGHFNVPLFALIDLAIIFQLSIAHFINVMAANCICQWINLNNGPTLFSTFQPPVLLAGRPQSTIQVYLLHSILPARPIPPLLLPPKLFSTTIGFTPPSTTTILSRSIICAQSFFNVRPVLALHRASLGRQMTGPDDDATAVGGAGPKEGIGVHNRSWNGNRCFCCHIK